MNREDKRGIFFGVVGVLTLIVAIIGASLAYFSINAKSDPDAVTVQAATVQIVYESGTKLNVNNIIPSSKDVATTTFNRYLEDAETYDKCIDDNKKTVCGTYNFTLKNQGESATTITMVVDPTEITVPEGQTAPKKFKNLSYILYDISGTEFVWDEDVEDYVSTNKTPTVIKEGTFDSVNSTDENGKVTVSAYEKTTIVSYDSVNTDNNLSIPANSEKRYRLFIYLKEAGEQDYEQGAVFQGQVSIEVAGSSSTITGTLNQ